jgi:hypothetical protein
VQHRLEKPVGGGVRMTIKTGGYQKPTSEKEWEEYREMALLF